MTATPTLHPWSEAALFGKARLFVGRMEANTPDDWQFAFWSSLSLEILCRAALSHISPALLADEKDWRNVAFAIGLESTAKKFSPVSIGTSQVISRLKELVPEFTDEIAGICNKHTSARNSELHSGALAFAAMGTSAWLGGFYLATNVLLGCLGKTLSDLFQDPSVAQSMIATWKDETAQAVKKDIAAHAQVWANKSEPERTESAAQATVWATRQAGHRIVCPACNSPALIQGNPTGSIETIIKTDEVIQRQARLPTTFECVACGLRINGLSKLSACGLGDAFSATSRFTAAEFFGLYTEEELEEVRGQEPDYYEDDFNE
jgi:transcription elongation factor Elf1